MTEATIHGNQTLVKTALSKGSDEEVYVFPASYGQQRLWFLDQFEPGSPYYNIPAAFRLKGRFDTEMFRRAIGEIVRRHETLRTTFSTRNNELVQVIHPTVEIDIPLEDLTGISGELRPARLMEIAREEARRPFNLSTGPLLRAKVLRVSELEHVVLATMHHVISDGWSIGVLVRELAITYSAFLQGRPSPLPELPIQYADYAEWQRELLQGEVLGLQTDYWKSVLAGCSDLLELPTDRPRLAVYSNAGATASRLIPRPALESLERFSRHENVTLFMTLIAGFATLLHRYSRQDDLNIGTPIANRTRQETEGLIGLFINTLVLRLRIDGGLTFRELLQRVKETTLGAYSHQDLPFERLVDALQVSRDMSRSPLFQVMFILQNMPVRGFDLPGISLEQIDVDMGTSTAELTLSLAQVPGGLKVSAEYNTDLFDNATIERMLEHYHNILEHIVRDPVEKVSRVRLLSPGEEHQILRGWNEISEERLPACVHELFTEVAQRTPEAPAVVLHGQHLTYGQLEESANRFANRLRRLGVGPEIRVGICLEKCLEMIVAIFGVLKAGGAYVPLDPAQPGDRLASMIEDAGMPLLLTSEEIGHGLPQTSAAVLLVEEVWRELSGESAELPVTGVEDQNLAYMIYTSGTTGKPKGTMVSHRSLVNAYLGWEGAYTLKTVARSHLQMANFAFDVFSGDLVRALLSGGKLVLCPREVLLDAEQLYELMVTESVTIAEFVPAVLRNLIQYLQSSGNDLSFMRLLIAGSDIWYVREYREFQRYVGRDTRLINSFGLTEATIDSSYFEVSHLELPPERLVPIGRPFANSQIYILDPQMQPAPMGVPGEVFVGGLGLARGYHGRSDLTAEKFVPDPFLDVPGSRLYRTGDLGRFLPDGNIEFLGRIDHQVKIRGFRVELGEIETALARFPAVKEGVVVLREDSPGDKRAIAYLVPVDGMSISISELRRFLVDKLPEYMVPSAFVPMERLPLTANGKVDRKALPAPEASDASADTEYVPPRNDLEKSLAEIWMSLLGVRRVGVFDNFFMLGGHSLLATQLVARIRQSMGVGMVLRKVFEAPTIAAMAEAVEQARAHKEESPTPSIPRGTRPPELPLSFSQQRLWFLDQLDPNSALYNIPEVYRISGALNPTTLEKCLNEVVRRHESLRTSFSARDGNPIQTILPMLTIELPQVDLTALPEAEREEAALRYAREAAGCPIPLERPPLFRVAILRLAPTEHIIVVILHHIISDNWSTQVFIREIAALYGAFTAGRPSPLPELPIQYADYALWQRSWLQGEVLESQISYWKNALAGSPPVLEIPLDRPRPAVQTFNGAFTSFTLSPELTFRLRHLSTSQNATMFMTLLAAFDALLYRYTGQMDISVGTPVANRTRREVEPLIGFFVNTIVLRADLSGMPTFRELVGRVRTVALEAYAHQDLPFERLVDILQPQRRLSHAPLFQVMFTLQSPPGQVAETSALTISPVETHSGTSKFDLTLFMVDGGESLGGALEYNTDLFDSQTIERMIGHFRALLEAVAERPDESIARISILGRIEEECLLQRWNGIKAAPVTDLAVHQRFERQARLSPDAVAVEFRGATLTYSNLNRRANILAHTLLQKGIGPGSTVGIMIKRSPELVVSLFGVLKSGAAYVPLDPEYPSERLAFMAADSAISVLITSRELADRRPQFTGEVLLVDEGVVPTDRSEDPVVPLDAADLAYLIYTSGSTGRPKGTMITHGGLSNYLDWCLATYPFATGCGSIVHSTIAFDATVTAIYPALLVGKQITLIPQGEEIEGLSAELRSGRAYGVLKITPAHLELLGHQLKPEEVRNAVGAFVIGGENLTIDNITFWQKNAPETRLYNEYGPTETVVGCVVYEVPAGYSGRRSVLIGRSIPNTSVYVLDQLLQPVPIGVAGELLIGGVGVARGYMRRPDLTADRFVPDPFSGIPGGRLYRTGDRVRYLPDGQMEFMGRMDEQVKIRGYRIEPGEVETVLMSHPGVKQTVVVVREDVPENRRLVAYVVGEAGATPSAAAMKEFLDRLLPDYMIPAAYVTLEALPLTPNGKIDRRALPEPDPAVAVARSQFVAPRSPEEEIIAGIWSSVLGIPGIGMLDDFFDLGGHSLLATQVISRIRVAFGMEMPLRSIFEAPTVAGLAEQVCSARAEGRTFDESFEPIAAVDRGSVLKLSFAQQRLWFLDQLESRNPLYNIPMGFRISGRLDEAALEWSINEIVRRHESLRTSFAAIDGTPRQEISGDLQVAVRRVDLSEFSLAEQQAKVYDIARQEFATPFDLSRAPLFRVVLLRLAASETVLVITMHHIISDDWSTGILMREMVSLYHSRLEGKPSPLPPLRIQYADFAAWQRSRMTGETLDRQLRYWKEQLAGSPASLDLPLDHARSQTPGGRAGVVRFDLPASAVAGIRLLAREEGATVFMTLLAGFKILLARYTGQDDICVGTPIANRTRHEIEGLIGFFVNTLVIRTEVSGTESFRVFLRRVKQAALAAYAHQDLPFEMIVEAVDPERHPGRSPLFQVMFSFQSAKTQPLSLAGLELAPLDADPPVARFDLTLSIAEDPEGIRGSFEYNADLFEDATIRRMAGHFLALLADAITNPDVGLERVELLVADEFENIVRRWNNTTAPYPGDRCIHELVAEVAAAHPDLTAVMDGEKVVTYGELLRRADQLSRYLYSRGGNRGEPIAVVMEHGVELLVALLAVLKGGMSYVPLDPGLPSERLLFCLRNSGARSVLTQGKYAGRIEQLGIDEIAIDREWDASAVLKSESPPQNQRQAPSPEDLAYIIYTSGSTGEPKGVMIAHRGLTNLVTAQTAGFGVRQSDRILLFASPAFDASISEIFMALTTGAAIVTARREEIGSPEELHRILKEREITVVTLPPTMLGALPPDELPNLRILISAGESCPKDIADRWSSGRSFFNAYGPTETTVGPTFHRVSGGLSGRASVPIGRPISNMKTYIVDRHLQPVPIGVQGELLVGGPGIAWGYLGNAGLTAEKFVPDHLGLEPGGRLYRTGDLVRYLPDGNIEYLGRLDDQVKLRGFRVELGEVESALRRHEAVRDCAAVVKPDHRGVLRLVAYVVPSRSEGATVGALRQHLRRLLPEYMVPSAYVVLDELPVTASGKLNRRALPVPGAERQETEAVYVAPRTGTEEVVVSVWEDLLGIKAIGVYDRFFDLGGHSLIATQVISRIRKIFSVDIPLHTLFEQPTPAAQAREIEAALNAGRRTTTRRIQRADRDQQLPLSFAQLRLWFLDQLEPNSPAYNVPLAVRLRGPLDISVLERSLNEIVRRHEALRTAFPTTGGRAVQRVQENMPLTISVVDLTSFTPEEAEARANEIAQEEARRPFSLESGPLIRAMMLRLGPDHHIALVTMHHIATDGWSMTIFTEELVALYSAFSQGMPSPLNELKIQYADFAAWQKEWMQEDSFTEQVAYWQEQLQDLPPVLDLPTDRPRPASPAHEGAEVDFSISPEVTQKINALCREEGVTQFMALLAAWQIVLSRYSGQADVCVGVPTANRSSEETEALIGFFVNTLVMRTRVDGALTYREILRRVRTMVLGAFAHQDLPFEMLVDILQPNRSTNHSPLFQVMFVLQNNSEHARAISALTVEPLNVTTGVAKFDLTLQMARFGEGLVGTLEYRRALFDTSSIEQLGSHVAHILGMLTAQPDQRIDRIDLVTEKEKRKILQEWSGPVHEAVPDRCIHQLIEENAMRSPGDCALAWRGGSMTYDDMIRRSSLVAHELVRRGVRPGSPVAVCFEASPDRVVSLLGVLRAGAPFLPIDPEHPEERIRLMLEDSRIACVLTQRSLEVKFKQSRSDLLFLDEEWGTIETADCRATLPVVGGDDPAYIIYTSGSTGRPKGVLLAHRGLTNFAVAYQRRLRLSSSSRFLQFASPGFDASIAELVSALVSGGLLYLADRKDVRSASDLHDLIRNGGITAAILPPTVLQALSDDGLEELSVLVSAGEPCPAEVARRWMKGRRFFNAYGPTEATIGPTLYEVDELPESARTVSVGNALPNTSLYVLDERLLPVPAGVVGEVCIGGVGVGIGYFNRPEQTAQNFVPDPFSPHEGARLYRTGDLGRYRQDGRLEVLGRKDDQVKIRGFRIEPGEVVAVLAGHPAVRQAAVVPRLRGEREGFLAAYIVWNEGNGAPVEELRAFMKKQLPEYMVPSVFVEVERIPLTASGKVDRRRLPDSSEGRIQASHEYVAPRTRPEQMLAQIWRDVLSLKKVGIHDSFFDLGGDSILTIQVVAKAKEAGLRVSPRDLFEHPTIASLAQIAREWIPEKREEVPAVGAVALTPPHAHFFSRYGLQAHFNTSMLLEVGTPLRTDLLHHALEVIVDHHDALRARVQQRAGRPEVEIAGDLPAGLLSTEDLSGFSQRELPHVVAARAAEIQRGFDLTRGPLFRAAYFSCGRKRADRLLLVFHHLVTDVYSWRIFLEDLQRVYLELSRGVMPRMPEKTASYREWAAKLQDYARSNDMLDEYHYWSRLQTEDMASIPVDGTGNTNAYADGDHITLTMGEAETQMLMRRVPAVTGIQPQTVMLTALARTVSRQTGRRKLLVQMNGHGREDLFEDLDVSRTMGWFACAYPLMLDLGNAGTIEAELQSVDNELRGVPRHGVGFGILRYLVPDPQISASMEQLPHPEINFNFLGQLGGAENQPEIALRRARESPGPEQAAGAERECRIYLVINAAGNRLAVRWLYSRGLHRTSTIRRLARRYLDELSALARHCAEGGAHLGSSKQS